MDELIRQVVSRQAQEGLNDEEFARLLGMQRPTWNQIKNGKATPGTKFYRAVLRLYPTLADDVLRSIKGEETREPAGVA